MKPLVSVVIPTFNRQRFIKRCLDSLVYQTFKEFEVLVCDDGSNDKTADVVKTYKDKLSLKYYWHKNFGGPARPRNQGIKCSKAPYIAFLDSDDWWLPCKLEESVSHINAGADVVYHDLFLAMNENQKWFWRRAKTYMVHEPVFDDLITRGNLLTNSSVVIRKACLETIGGLSEDKDLVSWEDYDCWLRLSMHSHRFMRINQTLGFYWAGGGNITSPKQTIKNLQSFKRRYLRKTSKGMPSWYLYAMGRSLYKLGKNEVAIKFLTKALFQKTPSILILKIIITLVTVIHKRILRS